MQQLEVVLSGQSTSVPLVSDKKQRLTELFEAVVAQGMLKPFEDVAILALTKGSRVVRLHSNSFRLLASQMKISDHFLRVSTIRRSNFLAAPAFDGGSKEKRFDNDCPYAERCDGVGAIQVDTAHAVAFDGRLMLETLSDYQHPTAIVPIMPEKRMVEVQYFQEIGNFLLDNADSLYY